MRQTPRVDVVVKGVKLVLQCAADGNPPVTYTWIKVTSISDDDDNHDDDVDVATLSVCRGDELRRFSRV